jgi:hypothetical protein
LENRWLKGARLAPEKLQHMRNLWKAQEQGLLEGTNVFPGFFALVTIKEELEEQHEWVAAEEQAVLKEDHLVNHSFQCYADIDLATSNLCPLASPPNPQTRPYPAPPIANVAGSSVEEMRPQKNTSFFSFFLVSLRKKNRSHLQLFFTAFGS